MVSPAVTEGSRLGPYEVLELLGRGGMGEVYRARDPRLGRDVAVKVLPTEVAQDPNRLARFEREARAVAALNHPNILTIHDVGRDDGTSYLVTELLEGQTLREQMLGSPASVKRALGLALQIARGLEAAHARGIVHRDVKPENLLVTPDGRVKILDFGLAKLLAGGDLRGAPTTEAEATGPAAVAGTLSYMAPEQVHGRAVDTRTDVFSLGIVLYELLAKRHPFRRDSLASTVEAILHGQPEDLRSAAPGVAPAVWGLVQRCLSKDPAERYATGHDLAVALEALLIVPSGAAVREPPEERSPYPGLESFTERDAGVFFGREDEVEALWTRLQERRLAAVIGASGAGKTSFVRAGVVAHRPEGWGAVVVRPGAAPSTNLARALAPEVAGDTDAVQSLLRFDEPDVAVEVFARWRRGYRQALLVVDQFEELFTLNPPAAQARYAALLGRLAAEADLHLLFSLRDDFLIRCGEHPPLQPVFEALAPLLPLDRDALRRVLVEPARRQGFAFEDDSLVEAMIGAVEGERGALPLLAFAMAGLWQRRDRERGLLTLEAYEAIGGVGGALARHAEAALERIGSDRHGLVRELFRNLVTAQGTRAVVDREELLSAFPDRNAVAEVLQRLVAARLLTSYELESTEDSPVHHRIEIVHESLLESWPRLVRWQAQDADGAVLRDQLRQAAHLWDDKGRVPDLLWSGTAFREFELWRERYRGTLTALEQDYAGAMTARARRRRRLRRAAVAAVLAALTGVAIVIGLSREQALQNAERADREARRAEASELLALAETRLEADPTEALALTTASLELADTSRARLFAMRALWESPPCLELAHGIGLGGRIPAFDPAGERLALTGNMGEGLVLDQDGRVIAHLEGLDAAAANRAAWAAAGRLVTGRGRIARRLDVWSLPEGQKLRSLDLGAESRWQVQGDRVWTATAMPRPGQPRRVELRSWDLGNGVDRRLGIVAESPDGVPGLFTSGGSGWLHAEGETVSWQPLPADEKTRAVPLARHAARVVALDSPNGHDAPLFSRDAGGALRLYRGTPGPPEVAVIRRPETAREALSPDPSGRWLVGLSVVEARAHLHDRTGWPSSRPLALSRNKRWYGAQLTFHPSGDWLVATTDNFVNATFWPLRRAYPLVVDGPPSDDVNMRLGETAFTPDGRSVVAAWPDGRVQVWPVGDSAPEGPRALNLPRKLWAGLDIAPDGSALAVSSADGDVYVVELQEYTAQRLEGFTHEAVLYDVAFSPSGRRVAAAFSFGRRNRNLRVWERETGEARVFPLPASHDPTALGTPSGSGYERGVLNVAFLDENTLLTAGDGGIRRWDLRTGTATLVSGTPGEFRRLELAADRRTAVTQSWGRIAHENVCRPTELLDLADSSLRPLRHFGDCAVFDGRALDPNGEVLVTADFQGLIRVGRLGTGDPHVLIGHRGPLLSVTVSPDLRWIASMGEDNTLRLWPMPDLDAPPLHTLPREALIAKLESLTNLRAVRDPEAPDGWRIELARFPGWKEVPTW